MVVSISPAMMILRNTRCTKNNSAQSKYKPPSSMEVATTNMKNLRNSFHMPRYIMVRAAG